MLGLKTVSGNRLLQHETSSKGQTERIQIFFALVFTLSRLRSVHRYDLGFVRRAFSRVHNQRRVGFSSVALSVKSHEIGFRITITR